ncbi:MAG: pitrilysin family protein [bacterium]|nr:pitrilysin family protein [bacterium]
MLKKLFITVLILNSIACFVSARDRNAKEDVNLMANNFDYDTKKFVLDNGMTVILRNVPTIDAVAMQVWVKAGSIDEGKYVGSGISHFVEHMIFKGTEKRKEGQMSREIKKAGGDLNGYTADDRVVYLLTVSKDYFDTGLDVLSDAVMNSLFDSTELEKERNVILKEINMNLDNPDRASNRLFWESLYTKHPYRYPGIGYKDLFMSLTRDDVYGYYKKTHIPNNMIFIACGNFEIPGALEKIKNAFKDFKGQLKAPSMIETEPKQISKRLVSKETDVQVARLNLGFHTVDLFNDDMYPLDVLSIILGEGEASRLVKKIKNDMGLAYSIHSWSYTPQYPGVFGVSATMDDKNTGKIQNEIWSIIEELKKKEVSDAELDMAKQKVASSHIFSKQTIEGMAGQLAMDEMTTGNMNFDEVYIKRVKNVTKKDIQRVAQKYFNDENLTVAILGPVKKVGSEDKEIKETAFISEAQKVSLPNKSTLIVKEDRRLPIVSVRVTFLGGLRFENEFNNGITNFMKEVLLKGTKKLTADEISLKIEGKGGRISAFSGRNSFGLSVDVLKENLDEALEIIDQVLTSSVFPEKDIEKAREKILSDIANEQDDVFRTASNLFMSTLFERHPYRLRPIGSAESIKKITVDDIKKYYYDYCRPNNMVISVYGDVNTNEVKEKVNKRFADFKAKDLPDVRVPDELEPLNSRKAEKFINKTQSVAIIGFLAPDLKSPDYFPLEVLTSVLNGLGSRMFESLRGEKALAYYVGSFYVPGLETGAYLFYIGTIQSKREEAVLGILDQIKKLQEEDITDEELQTAKQNLIGQKAITLETIGSQGFSSGINELYGLGYNWDDKYKDQINKVTVENVKSVAKRYFNLNAYTIAVVEPEAKK